MRRKKYKKNNDKPLQLNNNFTKDQMIEIHAEAYYRALKRINDENNRHIPKQSKYYKWYEYILFTLNIIGFPFVLSKKFNLNNHLCDSILVLFISAILKTIGIILWFYNGYSIIVIIYHFIIGLSKKNALAHIMYSLLKMLLGSTLYLGGIEFSKESDSNKIYAYSACIIALISCAVSIIALLK